MKQLIKLHINGETHEAAVDVRRTLLETLREEVGLTGTKEGCGTGDCGACTVLINGEPTLSCLTLTVRCQGKDIVTIEGLATPEGLHPLQQAFLECGGLQCGFCTPGVILSAKALLESDPRATLDQVKWAISGNLCRCTGYKKIFEAIRVAADRMARPAG